MSKQSRRSFIGHAAAGFSTLAISRFAIDNMEGIDAHVTADGETVLTLVSDDNFSFLQRTLLLQFTMVE